MSYKDLEQRKENYKNWVSTHREQYNDYQKIYQRRPEIKNYHENWRKLHSKEIREQRIKLKLEIFVHYGGNPPQCACCGERHIEFLTIDHINNDGAKHRKETGNGDRFYRWLVKNNFPDGLQVLCWNCNCGKRINSGICPHKEVN